MKKLFLVLFIFIAILVGCNKPEEQRAEEAIDHYYSSLLELDYPEAFQQLYVYDKDFLEGATSLSGEDAKDTFLEKINYLQQANYKVTGYEIKEVEYEDGNSFWHHLKIDVEQDGEARTYKEIVSFRDGKLLFSGDDPYLSYRDGKMKTNDELSSLLISKTEDVYSFLESGDMKSLSEIVDPVQGLSFAFYADFGNTPGYGGEYVNLSRTELVKGYRSEYIWGYDESEAVFKMALKDYINNFLLKRSGKEIKYETITFNDQAYQYGGVFNTIHDNYPAARYVEYFGMIEEENPFSYQSLRFIFQQRDGIWYLIGIARDVATV